MGNMAGVQTISVKPLSPHVGAEIGNIDLTKPLTPEQVKDLTAALAKHGVIFFHDQPIDLEMHRRFARYFGELHIHVGGKGTASKPDEKYPEARRQHFDADSKRVAELIEQTPHVIKYEGDPGKQIKQFNEIFLGR